MTSAQAVPVTVQLQDAMPMPSWTLVQRHDPHSITKVECLARDYYSTTEYWRPPNHGQIIKDQKPSFTTQMCQRVKRAQQSANNNGWFLYKLGLRLSPHTKGWSNAAHSAAKQICQDDHVMANIQATSEARLLHRHANAISVEPSLLHENKGLR